MYMYNVYTHSILYKHNTYIYMYMCACLYRQLSECVNPFLLNMCTCMSILVAGTELTLLTVINDALLIVELIGWNACVRLLFLSRQYTIHTAVGMILALLAGRVWGCGGRNVRRDTNGNVILPVASAIHVLFSMYMYLTYT